MSAAAAHASPGDGTGDGAGQGGRWAGSAPRLVYLAAYDTNGVGRGQVHWVAGGGGPQAPIWLVPGADGQDDFVGADGQAYAVAQLPLLR